MSIFHPASFIIEFLQKVSEVYFRVLFLNYYNLIYYNFPNFFLFLKYYMYNFFFFFLRNMTQTCFTGCASARLDNVGNLSIWSMMNTEAFFSESLKTMTFRVYCLLLYQSCPRSI